MKRILVFCFLIFSIFMTFGNQAEFLNDLSEKEFATFSDCVTSFCYSHNVKVTEDMNNNMTALQEFVPKMPKKYSADKKLTVGDFSLMAMQSLKIKSGLFYLMSKSGRYATRELIELRIIPLNTSELEKLSGMDLIRLLQKVSEYAEKKKSN